jgi:Tfp pilus assembly protein PilN
MQDIDFLPSDFKRRRNNRHGRSWQIIVVGAALGLLIVVAMGQMRALRQVEERLAQIEPERQVLDARQSQLADLRKQLAETEAQADLIAYMGHPWPKTQLLSATLRSLPEEIVCDGIRIARESTPSQAQRRRTGDSEEEDLTTVEPAVRDMRLLQEECDLAVVAIVLEGMTTDGIELHRYLHRLNNVPLLDKVELHSLESTNDDSEARFQFEARLTVRPGFGQPNGPDGRSPHVAQVNAVARGTLP